MCCNEEVKERERREGEWKVKKRSRCPPAVVLTVVVATTAATLTCDRLLETVCGETREKRKQKRLRSYSVVCETLTLFLLDLVD